MVKTFREKNNESRRKCYNKKKEDELWEKFEYYSIDYHRSKHNHITWHWNDVPEDHLNNAGFIHDFNKHRLRRIALYNNSEIINKYKDYGLDGLSLDSKGVYHGIQAKCYFTKKVSANDIGTFQSVIINRLCNRCNDSKGYLYTIEDIETNLLEDISNGKVYNHEKISIEEKEENIKEIKEDSLSLWKHQTEALEVLKNREGLSLLSIICGTGKTVIAGHHLKTLEYETIICIAPLRVSVEQLQIRLSEFLDRETLLVDSDSKGTTDVAIVKKFLESKNKKIIFSTFDSAINILDKILEKRSYIVCDEVHNTVNNEEICNFINSFENGLLLTATPPEELLEQIETTEVYKYSLADAIKDKLVCDYTVWLPYDIEHDKIPKEINSMNKVDDDLILKSIFLSNGMLKTGSRRCIVYCKNRQECDDFCYAIKTVLREYHGIDCWADKIDCETTSKKRLKILEEFQSDNNDRFYILTSVRILDEAIDIKKCDSEFITYIGDRTNDIRLVQRLMRGSRIDSENINKHNNLFIWANSEDNNLFRVLSLLKEIDPNFHKKVKIISKDYDKQEREKKKIETKELVLEKGLNVKCVSLEELWEIKCQEFFKEVDKEGKIIIKKFKYGNWYNYQRRKAVLNNSIYNLLSRNEIVKEDIHQYFEKREKNTSQEDKFNLWLKIIVENNKLVYSKYKTEDGVCIGSFQDNFIYYLAGRNNLYPELIQNWNSHFENLNEDIKKEINKRIEQAKNNKDKEKTTPNERFKLWMETVIENNDLLKFKYKTETGVSLGSFQNELIGILYGRANYYKEYISEWKLQIDKLPSNIKEELFNRVDRLKENKQEKIDSIDKFKIWKEEVIKNNKLLSCNYTLENGLHLGSFQSTFFSVMTGTKNIYKNNLEYFEKELLTFPENIKKEIDDKIIQLKNNYLKKKDITIEDKFNLWLEIIIKNNDLVDSKYITDDDIAIGSFQTCLFTGLSGRTDIYKNIIEEWKTKIEKLPDNILEQIQKRVDNITINNSKNKLSLDEKFELWKKLIIENNGLLPSNYKNGDVSIGSFQDTLIVGLSGKSKYKSFLEKWKQEIEQFPEEVKNQINLRIKCRLETITIEDKLEIWKKEVLKNKGLVDKKLTINDHIKIGGFQTILLSTLSGSNNDYKQYIESWTKEINSFPKNIKNQILEKIKNYKITDVDLKFNLWREEILKNNKLVEQNLCIVNEEDNVIRLGYFQNRLLKVLSGDSNLYPTFISKWKQEIEMFPNEIKNEINLRIKNRLENKKN